jgi:hypothetical protein
MMTPKNVSKLTGESLTTALTEAVCERLDRLRCLMWSSWCCSRTVPPEIEIAASTCQRRCLRGCSSMVEQQPSKLMTAVRFRSPAPYFSKTCVMLVHPF